MRHKGLNPSALGTRSGAIFLNFALYRVFSNPKQNLGFKGYGLGYDSGKWAPGPWAGQWEISFYAGRNRCKNTYRYFGCIDKLKYHDISRYFMYRYRYHDAGGCTSIHIMMRGEGHRYISWCGRGHVDRYIFFNVLDTYTGGKDTKRLGALKTYRVAFRGVVTTNIALFVLKHEYNRGCWEGPM
jgi:hypothetical protein